MARANTEIIRQVVLIVPEGLELVARNTKLLPGVMAVESPGPDRIRIAYDPAATSPDQFLNLARQAGYAAELQPESP